MYIPALEGNLRKAVEVYRDGVTTRTMEWDCVPGKGEDHFHNMCHICEQGANTKQGAEKP